MKTFVLYRRVSTNRQGVSGLGLESQEETVRRYVSNLKGKVVGEFVEVESGKKTDAERPQLAQALSECRRLKATLVVAKLDRLSRDVAFIATLMAKKVEFVTADDPTKSPFMLHIKAAVAEEERRMIAQRTRDALAAAKERGVVLGNQAQADANKAAAAARDAGLVDILTEIGWEQPYRDIAEQLTERGVPTPRGGDTWNAMTVRNILKRLGLRGDD